MIRSAYTSWQETVFKWGQEGQPKAALQKVLAFLDEAEKYRERRLVHPSEIEKVIEKALAVPEGGRGYLHVEKRWPGGGGGTLLGYAWVKVEGTCLFALCHKGFYAARQTYNEIRIPSWLLEVAVENAGEALARYLKEAKATPPEKVKQVGNLLFGGPGFKMGPGWLAPVEDPKVKVSFYGLEWEDFDYLKFQTIAKKVVNVLKDKKIGVKPSLVTKALEGKGSLLEVLGLHFLSKYGDS